MKQTEVGLIPDDWEVKSLENICIPQGIVRGPFGGALKKSLFVKTGYKVYEQRNAIYKNITDGEYYIDETKYNEMNRFAVKANDYIISCSGTIGKIYKIPENFKKGIINQALLKLTINETVIFSDFFRVYFESNYFQTRIIDDTQGGAMKNLVGMEKFRTTCFPVPPIAEQQRIAKALSDVDTLISTTEKLIQKKQNIKQGTMQNLLTGKKRLPGFAKSTNYKQTELGLIPEDWEVKSLGEIGYFIGGGTPDTNNTEYWKGSIP
ncbi:MAG: restriction endonuclease subunit S, partial [Treponema sp.]|nr:restriction endonuclease subunit S [Treponema sp.]